MNITQVNIRLILLIYKVAVFGDAFDT